MTATVVFSTSTWRQLVEIWRHPTIRLVTPATSTASIYCKRPRVPLFASRLICSSWKRARTASATSLLSVENQILFLSAGQGLKLVLCHVIYYALRCTMETIWSACCLRFVDNFRVQRQWRHPPMKSEFSSSLTIKEISRDFTWLTRSFSVITIPLNFRWHLVKFEV